MAKRYIGDAVITIEYHDSGDYRGTVRAGNHAWRFDDLHAPRAGFSHAYDSPEAYDKMAGSAVSFASYYTTHNRGDDVPDWAPPPEVADAIEEAVAGAQDDRGEYEVRRSPKGKVHEEGAVMHEVQVVPAGKEAREARRGSRGKKTFEAYALEVEQALVASGVRPGQAAVWTSNHGAFIDKELKDGASANDTAERILESERESSIPYGRESRRPVAPYYSRKR